ncbi:MAG TPA: hypothetical protein QGF58_30335 [Myxococcota bacterium]|nr:hypothetical protein [Myxococcota bacterium]
MDSVLDSAPTQDSTDTADTSDTSDTSDTGVDPEWVLDEDKLALLRVIFESHKPDLVEWVEIGGTGDPTWLYNAQLYTAPLLRTATMLKDVDFLDGLSEVYLEAHPLLSQQSTYRYYYVPGEDYVSEHTLEQPAWMWLDAAGFEIVLESSQFLCGVAALSSAVADLPPSSAHRRWTSCWPTTARCSSMTTTRAGSSRSRASSR